MNGNSKELEEVRKVMKDRFREMGINMSGSMGQALTRLIEATDEATLGENFRHAQMAAQETYMQYIAIASQLAGAEKKAAAALEEAKRYQEEFRNDMEIMKNSQSIEDPRASAAYQLYTMIVKQTEYVKDPVLQKVIYQSGSYAVWAYLTAAPMPAMNDEGDDRSVTVDNHKTLKRI